MNKECFICGESKNIEFHTNGDGLTYYICGFCGFESQPFNSSSLKPKWKDCPSCILEHILWECELDYDPYEGSKADTIHNILYGNVSSTNEKIIESTWNQLSEERFKSLVKVHIDNLQAQIDSLKKFLN